MQYPIVRSLLAEDERFAWIVLDRMRWNLALARCKVLDVNGNLTIWLCGRRRRVNVFVAPSTVSNDRNPPVTSTET